jgi:putative ABC transport system ATP-binding protein
MTRIKARAVSKSYLGTTVLHDVDLDVSPGSLTVLTGPSGSGKTTLLNLVSSLDRPDAGQIAVGDVDVAGLTDKERTWFRAGHGHVFQRSGLLGGLTVRENIEAGHILTGRPVDASWVSHLIERLELSNVLDTRASRVSGGQAQRAALVRALAHRPSVVFADEPTASLDTTSTHTIHELLRDISLSEGTTTLLVSHDDISTSYATHAIRLVDGRLDSEGQK